MLKYNYIICFIFSLNILYCSNIDEKNILTLTQLLEFSDERIREHYEKYILEISEDKKKHLEREEKKIFIKNNPLFERDIEQQVKHLISIRSILCDANLTSIEDIIQIDGNRILQTFVQHYIDSIYLDLEKTYYESINNKSTLLTYNTKDFSKLLRDKTKDYYPIFINLVVGCVKEIHELKMGRKSLEIAYTDLMKPGGTLDQKINDFLVEFEKKTAALIARDLQEIKKDFVNEIKEIMENIEKDFLYNFDLIMQKRIESFYYSGFNFLKLGAAIVASFYFSKQLYDFLYSYLHSFHDNKEISKSNDVEAVKRRKFHFYKKFVAITHFIGLFASVYYIMKNKKYFEGKK